MDYIEKEEKLLQAYKDKGFPAFDGMDDFCEFVEEQMEKLPCYMDVVVEEQAMAPIWNMQHEGQELRDRVQHIDMQRRIAHNAGIDAISILNRLSERVGLERFMDVDIQDRHAVAEAIGGYMRELYSRGIRTGVGAVQ